MTSQYKLNNNDLYTIFGVLVEGGSNSFLAYPSRKDSMTHDFTDKNGLDIDLQDPRFNSREFTLNCALTASSVEDFWTKYNALFTELSNSGTHKLSITDLGRDYRVYYKEQRNIRKLTPLSGKPEVWIKFDLVFGEANWTDNIEAVYLIDHDGNYLIQ
ncbi:hypothetical protein ACR79T_12495 [Sphingobacterium spiritivorum]|uniref:hypothetical protein n=1 Tax=Sphingobacterium spiritivorum TaxID=258 RepID=UPI003DA4EFC9